MSLNTLTDRDLIQGRNESLEFLKEYRKMDRVQTGEMRLALSIPPLDWDILKAKYPILRFGSSAEQKAFLNKFLTMSESRPYRVS